MIVFPLLIKSELIRSKNPGVNNHQLFSTNRGLKIIAILSLISIFFLFFISTKWDGFAPWYFIYKLIPGADKIRAISRIILIILLPLAIITALFLTWLEERYSKAGIVLSIILASGIILENSHRNTHTYNKQIHRNRINLLKTKIAKRKCSVFYYKKLFYDPQKKIRESPIVVHLDAMWASFEMQIPTINGYSGKEPANWNMSDPATVDREKIQKWLVRNGIKIDSKLICIIE